MYPSAFATRRISGVAFNVSLTVFRRSSSFVRVAAVGVPGGIVLFTRTVWLGPCGPRPSADSRLGDLDLSLSFSRRLSSRVLRVEGIVRTLR